MVGGSLPPYFNAMPAELCGRPRWVVWKGAKIPYCATLSNSTASVTDPGTWASFDQAQTAYEEGGYLGVGFVLNGDGIVGVDLDKCVHNGKPETGAMGLLERIGCKYVEVSPSGTGLRGFGYGESITGARGKIGDINVELYTTGRYLTVTGHTLSPGPLVPLPGFVDAANAIRSPHLQKSAEDYRSHLQSSSVGLLCSSVGIPEHTLPVLEGQRNKCLFELVRYVKGVYPQATKQELREIAKQWHARALPVIGTKDFATTMIDFMRGWEKVKQPHGATMQKITSSINHSAPLPPGIEALGYGAHGNHLVRLCMALQEHQGNEPFFISARQTGEQLGIHFTDASKILAALVADGVLTLVSKGVGKVASRYRFVWGAGADADAGAGQNIVTVTV